MKKNQYISPDITIVKISAQSHLLVNSVNQVNGLDGASVSKNSFGGGAADVKSQDSYNVWDDDWSK